MKSSQFKEIKLAKCVSLYEHPQIQELKESSQGFVTCGLNEEPQGKAVRFDFQCGIQEKAYGIINGELVKLAFILDSSD